MEIIDINASSAIECRIVYLMVHNQECMDELAPRYKRGMFANRYYDMAARMAVGYYNRRKTVLGAQFQRYFNKTVCPSVSRNKPWDMLFVPTTSTQELPTYMLKQVISC